MRARPSDWITAVSGEANEMRLGFNSVIDTKEKNKGTTVGLESRGVVERQIEVKFGFNTMCAGT